MKRIILSFLVILTLVTSGCAAVRPFSGFEEIPTDKSSLYIIRPSNFVGMLVGMNVKVGGKKAGVLQNNHFVNYRIKPGKHRVVLTAAGTLSNSRSISINVGPSERVFLIAEFGLEGYFGIKEVSEEEALIELDKFKK